MRTIYRSLLVISLFVIFGWLSTTLIGSGIRILHIDLDRLYVDLVAGIFVNVACAANIIGYYALRLGLLVIFT